MDKKGQQLMINNALVNYAKVHKPGKAYEDNAPEEWSMNVYATQEDTKTLKDLGCTAREDKKGAEYFIAKRKTVNTKGAAVKPPIVVDGRKQPFTENIGNGSVCNVAVTLFPWERKGKKGVLIYLNAVQVVNHVPFGEGGADAFEVIDADEDTDQAARF